VQTDPQVGGMYVPVSKLENGSLTKLPILTGEMVQNSLKTGVNDIFGHLGTPKCTQKGKSLKCMYVLMSKLKNKPLTNLIGPFL
jgi:hypothetical protein